MAPVGTLRIIRDTIVADRPSSQRWAMSRAVFSIYNLRMDSVRNFWTLVDIARKPRMQTYPGEYLVSVFLAV